MKWATEQLTLIWTVKGVLFLFACLSVTNPSFVCFYHCLFNDFQMQVLKIKIYRTVILPVVYGCETWSLTLREERRLRVFENRVLKRIFGPDRDDVIWEWRNTT